MASTAVEAGLLQVLWTAYGVTKLAMSFQFSPESSQQEQEQLDLKQVIGKSQLSGQTRCTNHTWIQGSSSFFIVVLQALYVPELFNRANLGSQ